MKMTNNIEHPAKKYAQNVIEGRTRAPKYVKIQCEKFLEIAQDKSEKYTINKKLLNKIYKILKVLKMAKGPRTGKSIYSSLTGYQWLFVTAVICTVYRSDLKKKKI